MYEELFKDFPLTSGEEKLLKYGESIQTATLSQAKVISDLYMTKKREKINNDLITSNEKLADSNGKYAKALNILTGVLVFLTVVQILVQIFFK